MGMEIVLYKRNDLIQIEVVVLLIVLFGGGAC